MPGRCRGFVCKRVRTVAVDASLDAENAEMESKSENVVSAADSEAANVQTRQCRGAVCSTGLDPSAVESWRCVTCGEGITEQELVGYLAAEERVIQRLMPPSGDLEPYELKTIDDFVAEGVLRSSHWVLFWALDNLGRDLSQSSQAKDMAQAAMVWKRCLAILEQLLPPYHAEKMVYWDMLAQVSLKRNKRAEASKAWGRSYQQSTVLNTPDGTTTIELRSLRDNPPKDATALMSRYDNSKEVAAKRAAQEHMDWMKQKGPDDPW